MLNSPLAAATRARVYRQLTRPRPRERLLRIMAMVGTMLVHLFFLFGFVLGPAFQVVLPPQPKTALMQVRLIDFSAPTPPPSRRGTPPKERGPRHQGRSSRPAISERSANVAAALAPAPPAVAEVKVRAAKVVQAPPPPVLPKPQPRPKLKPTPELPPVPLAGEPQLTVSTPALQKPIPPKFQPEAVRPPQLEGAQPAPPPVSLAMPEVPAQAAPAITPPSIALDISVPKPVARPGIAPVRVEVPAAPAVTDLQPIVLPAQVSPAIDLGTGLSTSRPVVPRERPSVQAPSIEVAEAELEPVPQVTLAPARLELPVIERKNVAIEASPISAIQPSIAQAVPEPPEAVVTAPQTTSDRANDAPAPAASVTNTSAMPDVSRAPDAIADGSDLGDPGKVDSAVPDAPDATSKTAVAPAAAPAQQGQAAAPGHALTDASDKAQQGADQPGATRGAKHGAAQGDAHGQLGDYVQLKPHGDTRIMRHDAPNVGYRPTRFEQDWAPEGESSIDTALRHAVDKTRVSHTFHLPRGIRIKCAVTPLMPLSLFGCSNPDPPAKPLDQKIYDRLNLAPAAPLAAPAPVPAASRAAPAATVRFDNSAECAAARVAGSPPPPGCEAVTLPLRPAAPASSSSSWVPASDQFQ